MGKIIIGDHRFTELAAERDAWRNALIGLTSGGTEHHTPDACVRTVHERYEGRQKFIDTQIAHAGRLRAVNTELAAKLEKIAAWLERLAATAEKRAADTRFKTLSEANAADAKNYRATVADVRAALARARETS